jgi:hypothetical protein
MVASPAVPQGYILQNRVTHIRGLPVSSTHAFRYSTLSLLLGLSALESGQLDLASGLVFGYGGRWGRLLGLRSHSYLNTFSSSSIRQKLEDQLRIHRRLGDDETFEDAWIMTMPSILGFEGINPLTVYFCYKDQVLWTVVLEVNCRFQKATDRHANLSKDTQYLWREPYLFVRSRQRRGSGHCKRVCMFLDWAQEGVKILTLRPQPSTVTIINGHFDVNSTFHPLMTALASIPSPLSLPIMLQSHPR